MSTPSRRHRWMTHHTEPPQDGPPLLVIELEPEVTTWLDTLAWPDYVAVLRYAELLAEAGRTLTEPYAKRLENGVHELRPGPMRVTYWFPEEHRAVLLTVFRKKRNNEVRHKEAAYRARERCENEHQAADEHSPVFSRERKSEQ